MTDLAALTARAEDWIKPLPFARRREIYKQARWAVANNVDGDIKDVARYRMREERLENAIRDLLTYATTVTQERDGKPQSPNERAELMLQLERLADPIRPLVAPEYRRALLVGRTALSREPSLEVALATAEQERDAAIARAEQAERELDEFKDLYKDEFDDK